MLSVQIDMAIWHLAATFRGEDEDRANAAVDIDPTVFSCGSGERAQRVKLFLSTVQK